MAKVKPDSDSQRTPATHVELYCGSFVDIDKFILILLNADSSGPEALQKKIVFDDLAFVCYCCKDHMLPVVWFASYSRQRIRTSLPVCVPSIHYDILGVVKTTSPNLTLNGGYKSENLPNELEFSLGYYMNFKWNDSGHHDFW